MAKLYIVPTPIGNMEDITYRAVRVLQSADLIFSEDTRTTQKVLDYHQIKNKLLPYHQYNEHQQLNKYIAMIKGVETAALTSDAGTPGISDPGFLLIRACISNDIEVECLPGATALIPAVVNSGIPCDTFYFQGFLPHKKGKQTLINQIAVLPQTVVLYESPYRLVKTLAALAEACGKDRYACVCRELSKIHQEIMRGSLAELIAHYEQNPPKGEIVIVLSSQAITDSLAK